MITLINQILIKILLWYLNFRFGSKLDDIKHKTIIINPETNLNNLFKHILNIYHSEYHENGLLGVFKLRKLVLAQIKDLNITKFWHRDRKLDDTELKESLKDLFIF